MTRSRWISRWFCALVLAGAPLLVSTHGQDREGASTAVPHSARISQTREQLESALHRMEELGRREELLAVAATRLEETGHGSWIETADGWLPRSAVRAFWRWSSAGEGDEIAALDLGREHHPHSFVTGMKRQLARRGVDLLVVLVPTRLQVYPELLLPDVAVGAEFSCFGSATARFGLALLDSDVEVLYLARRFAAHRFQSPFGADPIYFRGNMHWTPKGAEVAADAVAERVRQMDWFQAGPESEGEAFQIRRETRSWVPTNQRLPVGAEAESVTFPRVLDLEGGNATAHSEDSPILVLGDSFCLMFRVHGADFATQLYRRLGFEIDLLAMRGGNPASCWQTLARRESPLSGKKLVIWIVSENSLHVGKRWAPLQLF